MKKARLSNLLLLHLIVLIFGFTGIWGKLVSLDSGPLVLARMSIAALVLGVYMLFIGKGLALPRKYIFRILALGGVIAIHWITFFEAIQQSNVSVTLSTMASTTLFVAIFSPAFGKGSFKWYELWLGVLVIFGIALIFGFAQEYWLGILLALLSSALAAIFTLGNAALIKHVDSYRISLWEMISGAMIVMVYLTTKDFQYAKYLELPGIEWLWIGMLAVLATSFAFVVSVEVMKVISPFTVAITVNLEPVYSILLALWIFGEEEKMNIGFYIGSVVIIAAIAFNAWLKKAHRGKQVEI